MLLLTANIFCQRELVDPAGDDDDDEDEDLEVDCCVVSASSLAGNDVVVATTHSADHFRRRDV